MYAEPSGSTGIVPTMRSSMKLPPYVKGSMPPVKLIGLGSDSTIGQVEELEAAHRG
jgi:hypothetical protein